MIMVLLSSFSRIKIAIEMFWMEVPGILGVSCLFLSYGIG